MINGQKREELKVRISVFAVKSVESACVQLDGRGCRVTRPRLELRVVQNA